jgi:deoxyribodipyrimidine photo-lyase
MCCYILRKAKKADGTPYSVFTPWSKKWMQNIDLDSLKEYPSQDFLNSLFQIDTVIIDIQKLGFQKQQISIQTDLPDDDLLRAYAEERNFPGNNGTSRLSVALRFGFISIRQLAINVGSFPVFLNELGWREFYMMILYHFPKVVTHSFKEKYDRIPWRNNESEFELWKQGQTGYPIVDAGMRELNETGYMHNRVRMITAGFLTKHLLIDWRWGEAWFAEKLLDFELASNNGGWQWASGSGCDAAPYFRVFNPITQLKKFDPELKYVRKWVPEFDSFKYTQPIVEHKFARERSLDTYKRALN